MNENDRQLADAVAQANELLQAIQDHVGRDVRPEAQLRFPRGYLRTNLEARKLLAFVRKPRLKQNLAYSVMLGEVYAWLLQRTDLSGIAHEMVVKAYLALGGSIAEALLADHFEGVMGKRQKFKSRSMRLQQEGVIDASLRAELDWLWDARCKQHLFEIDHSEFYAYSPGDFDRATTATSKLIAALSVGRERMRTSDAPPGANGER